MTLLAKHDALLLDLDGTVYRGPEPIPGAAAAIARARDAGVPVRFVTNNASKSPAEVAEHLRAVGLTAEPSEVATSAQAAAGLLAARLAAIPGASALQEHVSALQVHVPAEVLVVGTESLAAEVEAVGLRAVRKNTPDTRAVVQGHSPTTAWPDLAEACLAIRAGALWVACNVDPTLPTERGELPGNGSMVAAMRTATGREPTVAGKPEPALFEQAARAAGAKKPLVIGDRMDTDIAGAAAAGFDSLLVLSGVTTPSTLLTAPEGQRPQYVAAGLDAVLEPAEALAVGAAAEWQVDVDDERQALEVSGEGDALSLLRALCEPAWKSGLHVVQPRGAAAVSAARSLGLTVIDYR